jgi:membrane-bound serine protease (ClpP class)
MIWWVVFFFIVGIFLILLEFFLPGFVCGTVGVVFLVISSGIAIYHYPQSSVFIIVGEALAAVVCIIFGFYVLPRSPLGRALILDTSQKQEAGWVSDVTDPNLVGALGEVFTALRPAGTIIVNGKRLSAVSNGEFIEDGAAVRVIEVHGNRIVVEPASKS